MKLVWLRATRNDINVHLDCLKPAFSHSDDPKTEFNDLVERVKSGKAGFYQIIGNGVKLRFVGVVINDCYHIVAMTGKGMNHGALLIIEQCTNQGFKAITFNTYRKGMRTALNGFGFEQIKLVRQFNNKVETVHRLELRGNNG